MRFTIAAAALVAVAGTALPVVPALGDGGPVDERRGNVFFSEPDNGTQREIDELMDRMSTDSPQDRARARHALIDIGFWAVEPLVDALQELEPPVKCAAALTLEGIADDRAIAPLRHSIESETSHPFVAAFAALAIGRFRDPGGVPPLTGALDSPKSMHILRAAAPLTLARIHTPEAQELLSVCLSRPRAREPVQAARLLALGFFPSLAFDGARAEPSPVLRHALESKRGAERRAALLGYLVATVNRRDTRDFLMRVLKTEDEASVIVLALLGLSVHGDDEVTRRLSRTALRHKDDHVRYRAAQYLADRGDVAARADLLRILRAPNAAALKAASVLALSSMNDEEAAKAVVERLGDKSPLVRAAAAIGCTRLKVAAARVEAFARIDRRMKTAGESRAAVRHNFELARAVLADERVDVPWREVGEMPIFSQLGRSYEERLLTRVNRQVLDSLDLGKIHNLGTDTEILQDGGPRLETDSSGPLDNPQDDPAGHDIDVPEGRGPKPDPMIGGAQRTSAWPELRDLKIHLLKRPYFAPEDLPGAPESRTKGR